MKPQAREDEGLNLGGCKDEEEETEKDLDTDFEK